MTPSFSGSVRERKWTVAGFTVAAMSMNFRRKCAAGHGDIANVAHESDVGIVDGDVEIGLIVEAGGLIGAGSARSFFILRGKDLLPAARGIKERGSSHQCGCAG